MRAAFILPPLLCLLLAGCATGRKVYVASTIERGGVVYAVHDDKPFTGVVTNCYLSGLKKTSIEYRDGLKDGREIEWRESGSRKGLTTWRMGRRNGEILHWYDNQQKLFQGWMEDDKWVGECRGWHPDGRPAFRVCFQDGQGRGRKVVIKWNKDNLIREFADVQIDGEWIEWDSSGRIIRREKYLNGKLLEKLK